MAVVRPNECPRCGYAYSAWATPRAPLADRMRVSFGHRPGLLGLGHARAAMELEKMPWTCRCGTRLRRRPSSYGRLDAVAIVAIGVAWVLAAIAFPAIARFRFWPAAIVIGAWIGYRTFTQFAVEEVTDEGGRRAA